MASISNTRMIAGINIDPGAASIETAYRLADIADDSGYDLVAIQDHAYNSGFLDTWTLLTALAMRTKHVFFTPNVIDLALRPPAIVYKAAASLQSLSAGRVVLGVGGGAFEKAIAGYGGFRFRSPGELGDAFEEALQVLQLLKGPSRTPVTFNGNYHWLNGAKPGPIPSTPIPVWTGAARRRGLKLTGTYADGWLAPLNAYMPPEAVPAQQHIIDEAARAAQRDPKAIRRIYNLTGLVTSNGTGQDIAGSPLVGPPSFWIDRIHHYVTELGFDGFIYWPMQDPEAQAELFAAQVLPELRARTDLSVSRSAG